MQIKKILKRKLVSLFIFIQLFYFASSACKVKNCENCDPTTHFICIKCKPKFYTYKVGTRCVPNDFMCKDYNNKSKNCSKCSKGFSINTDPANKTKYCKEILGKYKAIYIAVFFLTVFITMIFLLIMCLTSDEPYEFIRKIKRKRKAAKNKKAGLAQNKTGEFQDQMEEKQEMKKKEILMKLRSKVRKSMLNRKRISGELNSSPKFLNILQQKLEQNRTIDNMSPIPKKGMFSGDNPSLEKLGDKLDSQFNE